MRGSEQGREKKRQPLAPVGMRPCYPLSCASASPSCSHRGQVETPPAPCAVSPWAAGAFALQHLFPKPERWALCPAIFPLKKEIVSRNQMAIITPDAILCRVIFKRRRMGPRRGGGRMSEAKHLG